MWDGERALWKGEFGFPLNAHRNKAKPSFSMHPIIDTLNP